MRISDWSSDVCSSDLGAADGEEQARGEHDDAEAEIGGDGLHRKDEERRDEGEAQPPGVEAEISAHGLANPEEGILAAAEIGGFLFHLFSSFLLGGGNPPLLTLPFHAPSNRECPIFPCLVFGFFFWF